MIVDANLLLYAVDATSPHHERARTWLVDQLNGDRRVGLPWPSLLAFLCLATHPSAAMAPLSAAAAWETVEEWLAVDVVWIPAATPRHAAVLGELITRHRLTGNLIPDAHLAALAIEHGVPVASIDSDFAIFDQVTWVNPLAA